MLAIPTETPLAKNCTVATLLAADVAVASRVVEVLTAMFAPDEGAVIATTGPVPTVTATAEDVAVVPTLSVTVAVSETAPAVVGVQARLNGAVVDVPIETALAKN